MYFKLHFYHGMSSFKPFYTFWSPPMVGGKCIKFLVQDSFNYKDITKDLSLSKVQRILSSDWACYNFQVFFRICFGHVISINEGSLCLGQWCFMGPN